MPTLSDRDSDLATRTILAEGGDPIATAHVIRNRALAGGKYGGSVAEIVTKPYAFEPWLHAGKGVIKNDPLSYSAISPEYQRAREIIGHVFAGNIPDPTKGATHFLQEDLQKRLGRSIPKWAQGQALAQIGPHKYFAPEGSMKMAEDDIPAYMTEGLKEFYGEGAKETAPEDDNIPEHLMEGLKSFYGGNSGMKPAAPVPTAAPEQDLGWGAGRSLALGASLGASPWVESKARNLLYGEDPAQVRAELAAAHKQYAKHYPWRDFAAQSVGSVAPLTLGPVGAELLAGRAGLSGVARGINAARNVLPERPIARGALHGMAQAAATHGLAPEGQGWGSELALGGLGGAVAGPLGGWLAERFVTGPVAPKVNQALAPIADRLNEKLGLGIRPTQISLSGSVTEADLRDIPQHIRDAQFMKYQKSVGDTFGAKDLTPGTVAQRMRDIGQNLDNIAARNTMIAPPDFFRQVNNIRNKLLNDTLPDNPAREKLDKVLKQMFNPAAMQMHSGYGIMKGTHFRDMTYSGGLITNELLESGNPKLRSIGFKLKKLMLDHFGVTNPADAAAYNQARHDFKKAMAVNKLTNATGFIDPSRLEARAAKYGLTGAADDFSDLAQIGKSLPKMTSTGGAAAVKKPAGEKMMDFAKENIIPIASGVGTFYGAGNPVTAALLAGGVYGAKNASEKMREMFMTNPLLARNAFRGGNALEQGVLGFENLLAKGMGGLAGSQVGAQ